MEFEWDVQKAERNFLKHGISFDEATQIFYDPNRISVIDSRYDYGEERVNSTGMANDVLIVTVTHTDREGVIRLISARPASHKERRNYYHE